MFEYLQSKSLSGAHCSYRKPWALRTGHCRAQLPASRDVLSGSDRGFSTNNGRTHLHQTAGCLPEGEITRRVSAPGAVVPRLWAHRTRGEPFGIAPLCPDPPGLPLPSSAARSSSEERMAAGLALRRGRPGEWGGPRHRRRHLPRGQPAPPRSSPTAPRPAPLSWKRSSQTSFASGSPMGQEGFPDLRRPDGLFPACAPYR